MTALSGAMIAGHGVDRNDDRPFQALGRVHGVERDGFFLGVGPAFDGARLVGPGRRHRLGEGAQAAHGVAGRQAEIEIDIGERALGLAAMALEEERTNAQHVDGLRQQVVRRRAVACGGRALAASR